jgi:hypothetical protein
MRSLQNALFFRVVAISFNIVFVLAAQNMTFKLEDPLSSLAHHDPREYCLKHADAQQIAHNYGQLAANFSAELAEAALSSDSTLYSTSANMLRNECLGASVPPLSPMFTSRKEYIRNYFGKNAMFPVPYTQLDLWYACDTVIIRCKIAPLAKVGNFQPIISMVDLRTTPAPPGNRYPYYIKTAYEEFDYVTYLAAARDSNLCPSPTSSPSNTTVSPSGATP